VKPKAAAFTRRDLDPYHAALRFNGQFAEG
jgi:hypothetical protein